MPNYDSGRATAIGGLDIRQKRGSDLAGIRFNDNRDAPTSSSDMVLYRRAGGLKFWNGTTEYDLLLSVAGSVGDLNAVYEGGKTITLDEGAIVVNDATTGALNMLELNKTGAGSGNMIDVDITAAFTGSVLNLDMGSGIGATGITIDAETGARTGSDILVTDDSTGAHSVIDINKSGSGATKALDYVETYSGSSASFVVSATMGNTNGLDTTVLYVSRGTGARTAPVIDIEDGSTGSADIIDIDLTGVYTGDVFDFASSAAATGNVFFLNMDNAVAMTALHVEGSGVRTQPFVEFNTDCTGSASYVAFVITGATWSGHVFEVSLDAATTGDVLNVDMNAAVGGRFLFLDGGAATRTANMIAVTNDGDGNVDVAEITDSNTGSGHVFDINTSGIGSGNVIDITYSAADTGNALNVVMADNVAGAALNITGAGARTDSIIEVATSETGSVDGIIRVDASGVFTGYVMTLTTSAAATAGAILHLDLDAGVAYRAIQIDHAGARTVADILVTFDGTAGAGAGGTLMDVNVSMTGAGANPLIDIDVSGVYTGNIIDITFSAAATGDAVVLDMTSALAASAIVLVGAGARTDDLIKIDDSSTGNSHIFDINITGVYTGNIIDITFSASAATSDAISVVMGTAVAGSAIVLTGTGSRTDDLIKIDDDSTGNSQIFDINISGIYTGNVLDIVYSVAAATGDAIHVDMGTNLAGNAIQIDAAGTRTAPLINIVNTGADGGTDDHVILISQTGVLNSDVINITYSAGASDGNAIFLAMGTNVAGSAIQVTSAGTGTSGEGCILDVTHTGALAAGANLVDITSNGAHSSTSHIVSIASTGSPTAGSYCLYINASGADGEAIKVDAGAVVFDETLTVTGATSLSTVLFKDLTEVVTETNTILAAESGSVFFLNSATEFDSALPAPAAGLHFTFICTAAPSGANYTITTNSAANIIKGTVHSSTGGDADSETSGADTINFVSGSAVAGDTVIVWCDGTNWFAKAFCDADGGITITTAA